MTQLASINSLHWQPALGSDGIVTDFDDINQCIHTILQTPKGSDPHRPDFACDNHKYIDMPQNRAAAYIIRDSRAAILKWEPRIKDVKIRVAHEEAHVFVTVEWLPAAGGDWQKTIVTYTRETT